MTKPGVLLVLAAAACGSDGSSGADARPEDQPRWVQYIRSAPFPRLVLEVDSVPGMEPRASSEAEIAAGLEDLLDKPNGVEVVRDDAIASQGTDHAWTFGELDALATDTFDLAVPADTIKMHVLFVDGHYADDTDSSKVLGIAWAHTHLVMFKQTIETSCMGSVLPPLVRDRMCGVAETSIWTHEVGHLLGLVDNGLAMVTDHKDPTHGAHDVSDECVMYWAYEGTAVIDLLGQRFLGGDESAMGFDDACLADIAAVRGNP